jgi:hypothetical protein
MRDASSNMIPNLNLAVATRVCQTASFQAGPSQRAIAWVNLVCQIPGGGSPPHDISIVPAYSGDGGKTWSWMNPHLAIRTNPSAVPIFDHVDAFGNIPLKAGAEYLFAAEAKDRFGSGFTSNTCYCRTMVEIVGGN